VGKRPGASFGWLPSPMFGGLSPHFPRPIQRRRIGDVGDGLAVSCGSGRRMRQLRQTRRGAASPIHGNGMLPRVKSKAAAAPPFPHVRVRYADRSASQTHDPLPDHFLMQPHREDYAPNPGLERHNLLSSSSGAILGPHPRSSSGSRSSALLVSISVAHRRTAA
jgi:hypothetical protein